MRKYILIYLWRDYLNSVHFKAISNLNQFLLSFNHVPLIMMTKQSVPELGCKQEMHLHYFEQKKGLKCSL